MYTHPNLELKKSPWKKLLLAGAGLLVTCLVAASLLYLGLNRPKPLLSASVIDQATDFMPYFYSGQIPGGYAVDEGSISFDEGVMLIPLTKPGSSTVVLSQQAMPEEMPEELQKGGQRVKDTVGTASIQTVSEFLVGTLIAPGPPETLVLLSASTDTSTVDLVALLQGLKPVR